VPDSHLIPYDPAPPTRAEELTRQFYEWEVRGRGWQLWQCPVEIEPAFRHFRLTRTLAVPLRDDARKQTFLSGLADKFLRKSRGSSLPIPLVHCFPDEEGEPTPALLEPGDEPFVEVQLALPQAQKISPAAAEQFLLSLTYCAAPVGFELVGVRDAVTVQFVSASEDRSRVVRQARAYFPEASVGEHRGFLEALWQGAGAAASVIADFGLSREFMLPLEARTSFEVDPLIAAVGALEGLRAGEAGILQVLFKAARHPWAEAAVDAVTKSDGTAFFADCPEILPLARRKVGRPLFAVVVRVAGRSRTHSRALDIVRDLGGALSLLSSPAGNELIPLSNDGYPDECHEHALVNRCTFRSGMILNSEELVSLVHPPSAAVRSEKLVRASQRTRPAPQPSLGHEMLLGENCHDGRTGRVTLSAEQRAKHAYVIGASGTGKSTLLLNMIAQDIKRGEGVGVLDPHGDLIDQVLERVPEARHDDVILFDPADEEFPVGFNILSAHSELEKTLLSSDLVAVFRRLSTSWGDQMTSVLGNAVLAFLESTEGGTLADLRRFLVEADYRRAFLATVADDEVVYYWRKEFPLLTGKPQAPLLTRLDAFLRPKPIRHVVGQRENRLDFAQMMNGRKIFLAKLSQGAVGEENSYLLGTLLVSKLHQTALGRQALIESDRLPFYLYVDEFHNFITPSMASILSGARKYRLALTLAHQEFRQLRSQDTDVASAVIANPYTRICFRLGDFDAQKLQEGFSHFGAEDLQNLGVGEAIMRVDRSEYDFNLKTFPLSAVDAEAARINRERVIALSRQKYATRREDVVAQLARAIRIPTETPTPASSARGERVQNDVVEEESRPPRESPAKPIRSSRPVKKDVDPPAPEVPLLPTPALGRGGQQHRYLQDLVKRLAESRGYRVVVEQPVLGGAGSIDVAMERGGKKIACEISVTSTDEYEVRNIGKCLTAGYDPVVLLSSEQKTINKVRKLAAARLDEESLARVMFLLPEEFVSYLEDADAEGAGGEDTVRGYKVKVNYKRVDSAEKHARKQAISQVVLGALRRMKNPKE
jgi:hypothetical protein